SASRCRSGGAALRLLLETMQRLVNERTVRYGLAAVEIFLEAADQVPDQQQRRGILGGALRLAHHEIRRVHEEELRQFLSGLAEDELVQLVPIHGADLPDELDSEFALPRRVHTFRLTGHFLPSRIGWTRPCCSASPVI